MPRRMQILSAGSIASAPVPVAIVASRFNEAIVDRLIAGAADALQRHGIPESSLRVVRCPGAWELPLAARALAKAGSVRAIVALGCVVRGETAHFEHVAGPCCAGLAAIQSEFLIPVANGVLTVNDWDQAEARAGGKAGNKGAEAALAALEMLNLLERLR